MGTGKPLLLVHGISVGASSYEFRRLAPLLAQRHRVIAIDLLGCGLSDKPNLDYGADLFADQIADALEQLAGEPAAVVASSLGAAFAIRAAARVPEKVDRLAVICPAGVNRELTAGPRAGDAALGALLRAPLVGEGMYNALAAKPSIRTFLQREVYAAPERVTPEIVDHYYAVAHQPGARFVPAAFVGHQLDCDVARDLPFLSLALLVLWGERTNSVAPRTNADDVVRLARNARLETFADSALLPHEEEAEAVAAALDAFIAPQSMTA
ncbi:MAG TPA: alpha/beta fold hydrolase, partial [Candidatus Elarobacter sp.]